MMATMAGANSVAEYLGNHPDDRLLAVLPLSFDYGLNQVLSAVWAGAGVTLHGFFAAAELARDLAGRFNSRYGETFVVPGAVVPTAGARIMDHLSSSDR